MRTAMRLTMSELLLRHLTRACWDSGAGRMLCMTEATEGGYPRNPLNAPKYLGTGSSMTVYKNDEYPIQVEVNFGSYWKVSFWRK